VALIELDVGVGLIEWAGSDIEFGGELEHL
jgi:hypothetical protein